MEPEVTVEEFERVFREGIFNKITKLRIQQLHALESISENTKIMGKTDLKFPNTGITINNKLNFLAQEFEKNGMSMYAIDRGEGDGVEIPFIGDAIIEDLIGQYVDSSEKLLEYVQKMDEISQHKSNQLQVYSQENGIKKLFRKIRAFFINTDIIDLSLNNSENDELDRCFSEYKQIDDSIYNYTLRDNLVDSLAKVIVDRGYSVGDIPYIIDEEIVPDLEKMQLIDLVPKLKETIEEKHKEKINKHLHDGTITFEQLLNNASRFQEKENKGIENGNMESAESKSIGKVENRNVENEEFLDSVKVEDYDDKAIIEKHNNEIKEKNSSESKEIEIEE